MTYKKQLTVYLDTLCQVWMKYCLEVFSFVVSERRKHSSVYSTEVNCKLHFKQKPLLWWILEKIWTWIIQYTDEQMRSGFSNLVLFWRYFQYPQRLFYHLDEKYILAAALKNGFLTSFSSCACISCQAGNAILENTRNPWHNILYENIKKKTIHIYNINVASGDICHFHSLGSFIGIRTIGIFFSPDG